MFLSLFVACSSEITPVQAENSNTDTNAQTDAVADVIQLEDGNYLVEGDMILTPEQFVSSGVLKKESAQSALFAGNIYEWGPNPTIEYYFVPADPSQGLIDMNGRTKRDFVRALKDMSNGVALSFKEVSSPSTHTVYVYTYKGGIPLCPGAGACATVGKISAIDYKNSIYFTSSVVYKTVFHEMSHVLGFLHEHQRADRDDSVIVNSDDSINNGVELGDYLNTSFDMASIMIYGAVTPKNNVPAYLWRSVLPLQSLSDKVARQRKFGSGKHANNNYYIKHYNGKYLCRSTTGSKASITLNPSTSSLCIWDITTGALDLGIKSQYSGIKLITNNASTISSTEAYQGYGIYFDYEPSNNSFNLHVQGGGTSYAPKWIPISNGNESIHIWSPKGYCLGVNQNVLTAYVCTEENIRGTNEMPTMMFFVQNEVHWNLYPIWNTNTAY